MKTIPLFTWLALASFVGASAPAMAAPTSHSFVAKTGNDANVAATESCPIQAPCLTMATAVANTLAGGTITIVDEYDVANTGLTVNKTLTIEGRPGVGAVLRVISSSITVNAGSSDTVTFRNLSIAGPSNPQEGIFFSSGAALILDRVWLRGFTGAGINIGTGTVPASGRPIELHIRDSIISDNGAGNVLLKPANNVSVAAVLDRVTLRNSTFGIKADATGGAPVGLISVEAIDSVASANSTNGYIAVANPTGKQVNFKITRSVAHNNGAFGAVASGAQAFMIVSEASLTRNATGLAQQNGATVATYSNNDVNFNTTNTSGTITAIARK